MKKALSGILAALVLLSSLPTAMTASALPSDSDVEDRTIGHEVYVSTTGNDDTGDGSQGKPHLGHGPRRYLIKVCRRTVLIRVNHFFGSKRLW